MCIRDRYNLADMLIVGRFCGPVGASAVGLGGQVTILVINLITVSYTHLYSIAHGCSSYILLF